MYRKVDTAIWADERFRDLSDPRPCGKYLWFVLMTGKHTCQIPGVILAGPDEIAAYLRWDAKAFAKAFGEVLAKGMAKADSAGLIWLPNAPRHNKPESPNVIRSWRKTWPLVLECELKREVWRELKAFTEGLGKAFGEAFGEACPHPLPNQEQEQEQEKDLVAPAGTTRPRFDFESVYKSYPVKRGKAPGLLKAKATITTREDYDRFAAAVSKMATAWRGADTQFCPMFSTFVHQRRWEDEELPMPNRDGQTGGATGSRDPFRRDA